MPMIVGTRATSYSAAIANAVVGSPRRGVVHSVFSAAANIVFPRDFVLSLNAADGPRMPNGLQLAGRAPARERPYNDIFAGRAPARERPYNDSLFLQMRPGMHVLLGAQRLHIEAIDCSLDLSGCSQWQPQIQRPELLDTQVFAKNTSWLLQRIEGSLSALDTTLFSSVQAMACYWCGRGIGLTPTGDDMLAGWMATNWLLHGPTPQVLHEHRQIIEVAMQQTHQIGRASCRERV